MELRPLKNVNSIEWDKIISQFDSKGLFHQSAWLDFIKRTQRGEQVLLKIEESNKIIGYFPCFILRKGPFKILGSPCIGWTTNFMGPVVNKDFNQIDFLDALDKYCKSQKIDHLEFSNPIFDPKIVRHQGFQCREGITYAVELSPKEEFMWKNLKKKSCRWAIHKAQKNNLIVEDTNDPRIINEYYSQLIEVFARQKLIPTYQYKRPEILFNSLKKHNLLFSLRIKYKSQTIATGLFPYDNRCVYFWGGASWSKFRHFCPNDLLHWELMKMAGEIGILRYDMGNGSSFKSKFGGKLTPIYHWYKSYNPLAKIARSLYKYQFQILQKLKGRINP